jgi:hypothetical protein
VHFDRPTKAGITFRASIPKIEEPGLLKDRVDMAWGEVKHGLIRAVSVGFRPTKDPKPNSVGGLDWPAVEIFELSTVAVPAQELATIDQVKAIDAAVLRGEAPAAPLPQLKSALETMVDAGHDAPEAQALRKMMADEADDMISEAVAEHGKDWSVHAGMGVTARFANILTSYMVAKFGEIEQRFEEQGRAYKGVWKDGRTYPAGTFITHSGSVWWAERATERKPGEGDWVLAVKRGADAK